MSSVCMESPPRRGIITIRKSKGQPLSSLSAQHPSWPNQDYYSSILFRGLLSKSLKALLAKLDLLVDQSGTQPMARQYCRTICMSTQLTSAQLEPEREEVDSTSCQIDFLCINIILVDQLVPYLTGRTCDGNPTKALEIAQSATACQQKRKL